MQAKLTALFTTATGWSLIIMFLIGGLSALGSHGGSWVSDVVTVLSFIGGLLHPTEMVGGSKIG